MAGQYSDGDIIADSFKAEIGGNTYVVNNLSLTTPSVPVERNDAKGRLAAKKILRDNGRMSGSAELQIPTSVKNVSLINQTFTVPADANSAGVDFIVAIEEETANVAAGESRTRSANIRKLAIVFGDIIFNGTALVFNGEKLTYNAA